MAAMSAEVGFAVPLAICGCVARQLFVRGASGISGSREKPDNIRKTSLIQKSSGFVLFMDPKFWVSRARVVLIRFLHDRTEQRELESGSFAHPGAPV